MTSFSPFCFPYDPDPRYAKRIAYFSMEYAIDQCLKIYAGPLGDQAGSHLRSAYALKQNLVGIGILWKYGYYDQIHKGDQTMGVLFEEKIYGFLEPTNIKFELLIDQQIVQVEVFYLPPEVFDTAPLFLLSTDLPENTYPAQCISHRLYNTDTQSQIAAGILLGTGGAKLLELLGWVPDVYHLNQAHALPLAFHLYEQFQTKEGIAQRLVFTHPTGQQESYPQADTRLLHKMHFFGTASPEEVSDLTGITDETFDNTLAAMRLAGLTNGVCQLHGKVVQEKWRLYDISRPITAITTGQNAAYWADKDLYKALSKNDDARLIRRKKQLKQQLFAEVADQTGEIYDENILTLIWARQWTDAQRPDLLLQDFDRFHRLLTNQQYPIQVIWAGKPFPMDYQSITVFDHLVDVSKRYANCSVLVGYELKLAKLLQGGADLWLNTPRLTHESGDTSGMSAAMNGAINLSMPDGWMTEFAQPGHNSFIISPADPQEPPFEQDQHEAESLLDQLESRLIPLYYEHPDHWLTIVKNSLHDIVPAFDSDRMAMEYYQMLYATPFPANPEKGTKRTPGHFPVFSR